MESEFSLFPERASTFAGDVDRLYFFIVGVSAFFSTVTAVLLVYFAIKYRRRSEEFFPQPIVGSTKLEMGWSAFLLLIFLGMFVWSARLHFKLAQPPDDALAIYVVGRQWMWKIQ